jgi:thioredoxin-dependent peroxiredoxin
MPRLEVGDLAPDFTLPTADGSPLTLSTLRPAPVVVFFYPKAGTPGCTTEACDFRDAEASLTAHGYTVLGVSPDSPAALTRFTDKHDLPYPLLSDPDHEVMEQWGAWGQKTSYGRTTTGVIRSTVVVGPDGTVVLARYNVKATGHVASLRRALGIDG